MNTKSIYFINTSYLNRSTHVWKCSIKENGITFVGATKISGRPINRYAMNEFNDVLRMGVTDVFPMGATNSDPNLVGTTQIAAPLTLLATNKVYCLAEENGVFTLIGESKGIAPGENLHSARFIGTRGYMVTFKKVDPFFTIDMADPKSPKVIGELKIPGFSDYLHPIGENHILALGKDTEDMGSFAWFQGIQLSIFDVSDFENPKQVHKEVIGVRGTDSEARFNPKAFNYWDEKKLLALPIDLYEGENDGPNFGTYSFSGIYVYEIDTQLGFKQLGRIPLDGKKYWHWWKRSNDIEYNRGVFIDDEIYGVSNKSIKRSAIDNIDPETIEHLSLE